MPQNNPPKDTRKPMTKREAQDRFGMEEFWDSTVSRICWNCRKSAFFVSFANHNDSPDDFVCPTCGEEN